MRAFCGKKQKPRIRPVALFLATFVVLVGGYYALILQPWCDRSLYGYLAANARAANTVLRWLAQDTHVSGVTVRSSRYAISIRRGCDGIEPAWLFCAAVIAFPAPWKRKVAILPAGVALILGLNLVRIVSLYFIGLEMPAFFPTAHLEIWPAVFMVAALILWGAWVGTTKGNSSVRKASSLK
jgi:exosortase H (IPTLxxWG-CTERM-specific)